MLLQGWTLNYEMFFYGVFACTLVLPVSRRLPALTLGLVGLTLVGAVAQPEHPAASTYTSPMLLEFLAGAVLCRAWQRGWLPRGDGAFLLLGAGVVAFILQITRADPHGWRWLAWGGPSVMIVAGALGMEAARRLPRVPALRLLGDSSYSLYLSHLLTLTVIRPVVQPLPAFLAVPAAILACVAVGLLVYIKLPSVRYTRD